MRIYFIIFTFFIIGCNSDSIDYPTPKEHQVYEHIKTGDKISIFGVGSLDFLKAKAEEMDDIMSGKILKINSTSYPAVIIYDPSIADEKCVCYFKVLQNIKFEWHIITVEEVALNYKLIGTDSLDQEVIN